MMRQNELILTMDMKLQYFLEKQYPFVRGKIQQLEKWRHAPILDSYGQSVENLIYLIIFSFACIP